MLKIDFEPTNKSHPVLSGVSEGQRDALALLWDVGVLLAAEPKLPEAAHDPVHLLTSQGSE